MKFGHHNKGEDITTEEQALKMIATECLGHPRTIPRSTSLNCYPKADIEALFALLPEQMRTLLCMELVPVENPDLQRFSVNRIKLEQIEAQAQSAQRVGQEVASR